MRTSENIAHTQSRMITNCVFLYSRRLCFCLAIWIIFPWQDFSKISGNSEQKSILQTIMTIRQLMLVAAVKEHFSSLF